MLSFISIAMPPRADIDDFRFIYSLLPLYCRHRRDYASYSFAMLPRFHVLQICRHAIMPDYHATPPSRRRLAATPLLMLIRLMFSPNDALAAFA